jgi:hypothetical protein
MQFPLRTLVLLPAFVGLVLGHYLFLERNRIIKWNTAGQFWGRFGVDCLFMVTATTFIVGCYATLRPEERVHFTHGPLRLLLRVAVFVIPFVAGLNVVIGSGGTATSRFAYRVSDVYAGILMHGGQLLDLITVGWHVVATAVLGFVALWICRRFVHAQGD